MTDDQLIAGRHLGAPVVVVWRVLTTPGHLAGFWGGGHAVVVPSSVVVDLRVGGGFELETRSLDGAFSHRLVFRYEIIDEPRRLVFTEPRTGIVTDIGLLASGGGTDFTIHQRRLPPELRTEQARNGLEGILDRLQLVIQREAQL